jgi:hypothetical protein
MQPNTTLNSDSDAPLEACFINNFSQLFGRSFIDFFGLPVLVINIPLKLKNTPRGVRYYFDE